MLELKELFKSILWNTFHLQDAGILQTYTEPSQPYKGVTLPSPFHRKGNQSQQGPRPEFEELESVGIQALGPQAWPHSHSLSKYLSGINDSRLSVNRHR